MVTPCHVTDFVVGSKATKFPYYLDAHAKDHLGEQITDGWMAAWPLPVPSLTDPRRRTLVVQYRADRAKADMRNIDKQVIKANQAIAGTRPVTHTRFLKIKGARRELNQVLIDRARRLAGYLGYVTNLQVNTPDRVEVDGVDAGVVVRAYHQLYEVERSFRMSKSELLKARPIFHRLEETIQAHLTVVFAALAISRAIQRATGITMRHYKHQLEPLRTAVIKAGNKRFVIGPEIPDQIGPLLIENHHQAPPRV